MSKAEIVQFDEAKLKVRPKTLEELGEKCDALFFEARRSAVDALRWAYELGREISEYAERDEITEAVKRINFPNGPKGPKKEGRPKSAVGYVIELLAARPDAQNLSASWMLRCTRAFEYCAQKKLPFTKGIEAVLAAKDVSDVTSETPLLLENALPNLERVLPAEPKKDSKPEKGTPINREVAKICKHVEKFFVNGAGHPRVRKASDVSALLRGLHKVLKAHASAEVIPDQKA